MFVEPVEAHARAEEQEVHAGVSSWTPSDSATGSAAPRVAREAPHHHVLHVEPGFCVAEWGPLLTIVWRQVPTLDALRVIEAYLARFAAAHPGGGVGVLLIVEAPGLGGLDAATRDENIAMLRRYQHLVRCKATVLEGQDARAWVMKTVAIAVNAIAPGNVATRIFGRTDSAVSWAATRLDVDAVALASAANRLRENFGLFCEAASCGDGQNLADAP
jgi:hypothetical protein